MRESHASASLTKKVEKKNHTRSQFSVTFFLQPWTPLWHPIYIGNLQITQVFGLKSIASFVANPHEIHKCSYIPTCSMYIAGWHETNHTESIIVICCCSIFGNWHLSGIRSMRLGINICSYKSFAFKNLHFAYIRILNLKMNISLK